jgi:hypothetical protein
MRLMNWNARERLVVEDEQYCLVIQNKVINVDNLQAEFRTQDTFQKY